MSTRSVLVAALFIGILIAACSKNGGPIAPSRDLVLGSSGSEEISAEQINAIGKAQHEALLAQGGKRPSPSVEGWQLYVQVPFYSQKDPGWASVPLGFGSETIGQSGCLLASISMNYAKWGIGQMNPFELNTWCKKNGGFAWPNLLKHNVAIDYGRDRSSRVISVDQIYPELAAGHPVVIRIKTASIPSHYLVIFAFDGTRYWVKESLNDWARQNVSLYGELHPAGDPIRVYGY